MEYIVEKYYDLKLSESNDITLFFDSDSFSREYIRKRLLKLVSTEVKENDEFGMTPVDFHFISVEDPSVKKTITLTEKTLEEYINSEAYKALRKLGYGNVLAYGNFESDEEALLWYKVNF